ncbi:class I poly(R)-hydroxyalkanoic acid synthase [Sterolibacterium denitrificans]|nr:class I poly(R)-hydroxyalkanoic acid synthase [Sterolibacterium denitrificans]
MQTMFQAGQSWAQGFAQWLAAVQAQAQSQPQSQSQSTTAQAAASASPTSKSDPAQAAAQHGALQQLQQAFMARHMALWQAQINRSSDKNAASSTPDAALPRPQPGDRRFSAAEWANSPIHDYFRQSYLLNAEYVGRLVELLPAADTKARERMRFMARQYVDALAPSNFAATNPEFIETALASQGESINAGIRNLLADIEKGHISLSDETAFEVGRNLAITPGAVVFENEVMQLIQYAPLSDVVGTRPLVIVPPCINKYYILDLQPENSLVRHAIEQGNTVFMVSWRNPQAAQGHLGWDDYVEQGVLRALAVAAAICGVEQVNALGFCVGGTLLSTALAVARARGETPVTSLTLLTTLLDFADPGELGLFIDQASVAAREASIGKGGLMKGSELAAVFSSLRANDLIWQYVVSNYLKGGKPPAFDLLYWNADSTNLPGPFAVWYLRNMYLENRLRSPGRLTVCGEKVDLRKVDMPVFLYASREDHIVPWQAGYRSRALLGGRSTFVMGASGHIAGVINPPAKNRRSYWVGEYAGKDAERWLAGATEQRGSWWPTWTAWLQAFAGKPRKARVRLGSVTYKALEPAPGRYVREKAS